MPPDIASELAGRAPVVAAAFAASAEDLDLPYVAMGHLARSLVDASDTGEISALRPVFDDVEDRLATGDGSARNLLIVGLLESLQNIEGARANRWEPLLGPATKAAWTSLNEMWAGRLRPSDFNRFVDGSSDIHRR